MLSFSEVRDFLVRNGSIELPYLTNHGVTFSAKADICCKGKRKGMPIIKITSGKQSVILVYERDWGNKYTVKTEYSKGGTLIYHACEPLSDYISKNM